MTTLSRVLRILLGALFLYAGFTKLYPPEHRYLFEMALSSYRILPVAAVIAVAAVLPWLEILLGGLLISGWKLRYTASFASLLLLAFISITASTYFRRIEADCGCFGFGEPLTGYTLIRDAALLLLAILLAAHDWWTFRHPMDGGLAT
jgi:uncharacterized membrane protein YphA (DoxX/SURF4 family)